MWQTRTGTWTGRHPSDPLCGITITWPDDGRTRLERMRRLLKPAHSPDGAARMGRTALGAATRAGLKSLRYVPFRL